MRVMLLALAICVVWCGSALAQDDTTMTTANAISRASKRVTPEYPIAARQLNIQGQQEVAIEVNAQGDVTEAKVLKGNAMFTAASVAAAKQWKFAPYTKDGQAVKFSSVLVFNYTK
ncbi:energy transducer TonB [uncultured Paludibaculum sp.]|uniref:energy transducer TonB n=1 Tax=uncultured Paludibaculum sp. TaxID=1765020 RepID=UPI002AAC45CE|nr:energy transducer TonB [uncultured Paludibaculum sp.]